MVVHRANNAKALARERGTPWVPRLAPAGAPAVASAAKPALGTLGAGKSISTGAALSLVQPVLPAAAQLLGATPTPPAPTLPQRATETKALLEPATQMPQTPGVMMAGSTRFTGDLARA